jgi:ADP-heptose:LPS heptosyltransferase/GT2 family glycosyltransferase
MPLVTISLLSMDNVEITSNTVDYLIKNTPEDAEYILTVNGPGERMLEYFQKIDLPNKRVFHFPDNPGFIPAHNHALQYAKGRYFLVLNNDIYLKENGWLSKLIQPLEDDPNVGITGLAGNPSVLKPDGNGTWGEEVDYVEGSCLVGRTAEFTTFGLFSEALKIIFFEDSDLSMRFKQMGKTLKLVETPFEHIRGVDSNKTDWNWRQAAIQHNNAVFQARWGNYLKTRKFYNKVVFRCESWGAGDVLCMTPVFEGLRKDHPTAEIIVNTNWPQIFENNPHVDKICPDGTKHGNEIDRYVDLRLNFASRELIGEQAEKSVSTKVYSYRPQLYLLSEELEKANKLISSKNTERKPVVGYAPFMSRTNWQGRNWVPEEATKLMRALDFKKYFVVELGKMVPSTGEAHLDLVDKTSLREMFAVISQCDFFIGIDSFPFHVAQAFEIPSVILFGAVPPEVRIVNPGITRSCVADGLDCLGCYQRKGIMSQNTCERKDEACMKQITAESVLKTLLFLQFAGLRTDYNT